MCVYVREVNVNVEGVWGTNCIQVTGSKVKAITSENRGA